MNDGDKSLSAMLLGMTKSMDYDLAVTVAEVINVYTSAIRRSRRDILGADDAIKILDIITQIAEACQRGADPELIPGAPHGKRPSLNPS